MPQVWDSVKTATYVACLELCEGVCSHDMCGILSMVGHRAIATAFGSTAEPHDKLYVERTGCFVNAEFHWSQRPSNIWGVSSCASSIWALRPMGTPAHYKVTPSSRVLACGKTHYLVTYHVICLWHRPCCMTALNNRMLMRRST